MGGGVRAVKTVDSLIAKSVRLRFCDPEGAMCAAREALEAARLCGYRKGEGRSLRQIGVLYYPTDRMLAMQFSFDALAIAEAEGDDLCAAGVYMLEFCFYNDRGSYERAFAFVKQAYDLAVQLGDRRMIALALYNMGVNAESRHDFRMVAEYQKLCYDNARYLRNFPFRWSSLQSYGMAQFELGQVDEAIKIIKQGMRGARKAGSKQSTIDSYSSLAIVYNKLGMHDKAAELAKEGIEYADRVAHKIYLDHMYAELGHAYLKLGLFEKAVTVLEPGLELSRAGGNAGGETQILLRLAQAHAGIGNFDAAYEVQLQYTDLLEATIKKDGQTRIHDLEVSHRVELAQAEAKAARQQSQELKRVNQKLKALLAQKERLQGELVRLASTDELTDTLNRRQLISEGVREAGRFVSLGTPMTVLAIDIDHFKTINDTFGHIAGDGALRRVTDFCKKLLRKGDVIGRVGGEEFVVILSNTDADSGLTIANRLRQAIEDIDTREILDGRAITVSVGVCTARQDHSTFFEMMNEADQALYDAKRSGRNRVCVSARRSAA